VLSGVQAIATGGSHTCALMMTGGIRCWGDNGLGQLADGTWTDRSTPPTSDVLSGIQSVTTSDDFTCLLMTTGGVRCWGNDWYGQLGFAPSDHTTPLPVRGLCQ
jgi:alpha-tubulin suppressor-like RCC1 family protein